MGIHRVSTSPYDGFGPTPPNNGGFVIRTTQWQWFPVPGYYETGYQSTVMTTQSEAAAWGDELVSDGMAGGYHIYWVDPPPKKDDGPLQPNDN